MQIEGVNETEPDHEEVVNNKRNPELGNGDKQGDDAQRGEP